MDSYFDITDATKHTYNTLYIDPTDYFCQVSWSIHNNLWIAIFLRFYFPSVVNSAAFASGRSYLCSV